MRVAVASVMLCLSLAGCAERDPVEGRLEPGQAALIVEGVPTVAELVGSRVQVESDDRPNANSTGPDLRPVRCLLLDGPAAGTIRDVPRMGLRPITGPR